MITKQDIADVLTELNLQNTALCIHCSLKSLGEALEDGICTITEPLLKNHCTIMVPTFSYFFLQKPFEPYMPSQNGIKDYHDLLKKEYDKNLIFTPACKDISLKDMGIFAKYILDQPGSLRGNHPLNSFTALGPDAAKLISGQTPENVYAPLKSLAGQNGSILLMGVDLNNATIIHYAEQLSGRRLFIRWANDQTGTPIPVSVGSCSCGFQNLYPYIKHIEKRRTVGQSVWRCFNAGELLALTEKVIRQNPSLTHCSDPHCERCNDAVAGGPNIR